jgi:predicted DNA binding protein
MHEFVARREGYGSAHLLHWNPSTEETNTMILRVTGDAGAYAEALAEQPRIREFDVADGRGRSFFVYVRERLTEAESRLTDAFTREGVVVLPPVEYRTDGTIGVTLVGPTEQLRRTIEETPGVIDVDVVSVGGYDARRFDAASRLTDRQHRAVEVAVDAGYYEAPREATVADVAAELDCAPSTAAEHLRKAEAAVMAHAATGGSAPRS